MTPVALPILWIGFAIAVAIYAERKGRHGIGWFFGAVFISPLLAFLLVAASGEKGGANGRRKCPACAEMVRAEAIKCKHCGSELTPILTSGLDVANLNKALKR